MSDNNDGLGNLPKWPAGAKDLPGSDPAEPPRAKLKWALITGFIGGAGCVLRATEGNAAFRAGVFVGGFMVFAVLGLVAEYAVYDRERRRRRREDH